MTRLDGSTTYLPTRSEALAECSEYDRRLERVRCAAFLREHYRGLQQTRRALRYAALA